MSLGQSKPFSKTRTYFTFTNNVILISDIQQMLTGLHPETNSLNTHCFKGEIVIFPSFLNDLQISG